MHDVCYHSDMGTVVAVRSADRVVIGADSLVVDDGTVRSRGADRLRRLDGAAVGAVGDRGDVDEFLRRLEAEVDGYETERGRGIGIDPLARIAAREAESAGVDAVVAALDDDGRPRLRRVGADGSEEDVDRAALGTGPAVAMGQLESFDPDGAGAELADRVREIVEHVGEVDPETGGDVETVELTDGHGGDDSDDGGAADADDRRSGTGNT